MLKRFTDTSGRHWRVESSGWTRDVVGEQTIGVWFIDDATDWRVHGDLTSAEAEEATDERLVEALSEALREQAQKPTVIKRQHAPVEMFQINDQRYVQLVHDPAKAERIGYSGTESVMTFDEVALRAELRERLSFSDDQVEAAIALARLAFSGS